ncbi:hypothetical protein E2C01_025059 [Portunus trituberculatus]|uniref:Uncharacterized protein n=1 Tax=Portunus trituberculatus TaxID=210409 RepID=A0A5B7ECA4_PORTR|nr:hypothetical protein [Portunus trituberculatus]
MPWVTGSRSPGGGCVRTTIKFIKRNDQPEDDARVSRVQWRPRRPRQPGLAQPGPARRGAARQEWLRTSAGVWRGGVREVFRENGIVGHRTWRNKHHC